MSSNNTVCIKLHYLYCMWFWSYQVIYIVLHYAWNSSEILKFVRLHKYILRNLFQQGRCKHQEWTCLMSYSGMCCYLLRQFVLLGNQSENLVWCMESCLMHDLKNTGKSSCIDPFFHSSFSCRFLQEKREPVLKEKVFLTCVSNWASCFLAWSLFWCIKWNYRK